MWGPHSQGSYGCLGNMAMERIGKHSAQASVGHKSKQMTGNSGGFNQELLQTNQPILQDFTCFWWGPRPSQSTVPQATLTGKHLSYTTLTSATHVPISPFSPQQSSVWGGKGGMLIPLEGQCCGCPEVWSCCFLVKQTGLCFPADHVQQFLTSLVLFPLLILITS